MFNFFMLSHLAPSISYAFPTRRSSDLAIIAKKSKRPMRSNEVLAGIISPFQRGDRCCHIGPGDAKCADLILLGEEQDRKSTRLNSSHLVISYAVFCWKKKKLRYQDNFV